ncbi:MAG: S8 family serine peptidase [Pirellulales bacterium]|nr:S8 family serine peptidase [Pirellulales bacterium]
MRGSVYNAPALGVCGRLAREVADLLNLEDRPSGGKPPARRRSLHIEPLEARHLMDAAGAASLISAVWFQDVSDQESAAHAGVADWTVESGSAAAQKSDAAQSDDYDWIVQFDSAAAAGAASVAETASFLVGGGMEFEVLRGLGLVGQVLVRSSGASLDAVQAWLSDNVYVASFEQDAISQVDFSTPSDPYYNQLWGMETIDAPQAWNLSTGSSSVVVAVIDTGVDYTHVDLAANVWTNPGEIAGNGIDDDGNGFVDDVHGYDFINEDGNPMDDNGHGTHVSGTIAAVANNGVGVAGVNWSGSVMALKFLNSDGSGYLSDAVRAINYATMMRTQYDVNVRVTNNSWGGGGYSTSMYNAIQASNNADILFVAAAGNSSSDNDLSPQYPANYSCSNVISVAAISQNGQLASFSSYGATTVDLAAPGVSILSTIPGNRYSYYSGTSMATPHVAGVAALAFSLNPNASAAQVRNAILAGAETSSALAGKTATGGILNAYNTMQIIGGQVHGPIISTLAASPSSVMAGETVTLTAEGISDDSGTVVRVNFYRDANNNSRYDATDPLVGSTASIVGGTASVSIDTSALAAGTHRYLAQAIDNHAESSSWATASLNVLPPDDHGDSAATATAILASGSTAGTLGAAGDADWFKFQAVAGKTYVFSTRLGSLIDSTLRLYDRDGATLLRYNDDYGGSLASQITWTASRSGTYYIAVGSYANRYAGTYVLSAATNNAAPQLAPIDDRTISHRQTTLEVELDAADADGDPLSYSVSAVSLDPLAQEAYEIDQAYGLYQWQGSFWTDLRGYDEKYFAGYYEGHRNAYFILPGGQLYRWDGSIAESTYVATLGSDYYNDPFLLCNAQQPEYAPVDAGDVQLSISDGVLTIVRDADFLDDLIVQVTVSDGTETDSETFAVSVTNSAPQLAPIDDQAMSYSQTTLSVDLGASDADGDTLGYSVELFAVDSLAEEAYQLDQEYRLYQWQGSFWTDLRGYDEKYFAGYYEGHRNAYFILPGGQLYRWGGSIETSVHVTTLSSDYYDNPFLLCDAQQPQHTPADPDDARASVSDGVLTIVRDADYLDDLMVRVTVSDGLASDSATFSVSVTNSAPHLTPIGDRTMSAAQTTLVVSIDARDADGDPLSYSAEVLAVDPLAEEAYQLDQEYRLYQWQGSFWTDLRGHDEKYFAGYYGASRNPYFILPNGDFYRWGGSIEESVYVTTLSAAYYDNPFLVCEAQEPRLSSIDSAAVEARMTDNVLTVTRDPAYTNDFFVRVTVGDGRQSSSETFQVSTAGAAWLQSFASPLSLTPSVENAVESSAEASDHLAVLLAHDDALRSADLLALRVEHLSAALDAAFNATLSSPDYRSFALAEAMRSDRFGQTSSIFDKAAGKMGGTGVSPVLLSRSADLATSLGELRLVDCRLIDEVFDSLAEQLDLAD